LGGTVICYKKIQVLFWLVT